MSAQSLYETDFYAWTQEQVSLLRDRNWSQLDLPNLIEEIASFGKTATSTIAKSLKSINRTFAQVGVSTPMSQSQLASNNIIRLGKSLKF